MDIDNIAEATHMEHRAYNAQFGKDFSYLPWYEMTDKQKENAIMGVEAVLANPAITARDRHRIWRMERMKNGYVYGLIKHGNEHPALVPYEQLSLFDQKKSHMFISLVNRLRHCLPITTYFFSDPGIEMIKGEIDYVLS